MVVTPQPAWPPQHGAALRNSHLISALASRYEVDTLTLVPPRAGAGDSIPGVRRSGSIPMTAGGGLARLANLAAGRTPDLVFRHGSREARAAVIDHIADGRYDVLQIEGLQLAWIVPDACAVFAGTSGRPRIVYDAHNLEWRLQSDLAASETGLRAVYSRRQSKLLRDVERDVVKSSDLTLASTEDDAAGLRRLDGAAAIETLPHPVRVAARFPGRRGLASNPTVLLAANFLYRPNRRGAAWLFGSVWPSVLREVPDASLRITGPGSEMLRPIAPARTSLGGVVSDMASEYARAWIAVSPVDVGAGAPYKVLQAYAAGRPVVVRSSGLAGLPAAGREGLLAADSADLFARRVVELLGDESRRRVLGAAGHAYVRAVHDAETIGRRIVDIYASHHAVSRVERQR